MSIAQQCTTVQTLVVEYRATLDADRLNGRIEKAAKMVEAGQVAKLSEFSYQVISQSGRDPYHVSWQPVVNEETGRINPAPGWNCTCPDVGPTGYAPTVAFNGSAGRPICKHILAVGMVEALANNYHPDALPQAQALDPVEVAQATERKAQERQERASGHYNANLSAEEKAAKLAKAQAEQEAARRMLAKMNGNGQTPRGTHTGWYSAEAEEVAGYDPALAEKMERRARAYDAALRPDPINRNLPNRNFNIERR